MFLMLLILCTIIQYTCIRNSKLREQAVEVLRDLLSSHDSDIRYTSSETKARIACIYLPLLSVVMDNYSRLYKVGGGRA